MGHHHRSSDPVSEAEARKSFGLVAGMSLDCIEEERLPLWIVVEVDLEEQDHVHIEVAG